MGQITLLLENDIFILFEDSKVDKNITCFIQLILFMAKFHIHKKKWADSKPNLELFTQELLQYARTMVGSW